MTKIFMVEMKIQVAVAAEDEDRVIVESLKGFE